MTTPPPEGAPAPVLGEKPKLATPSSIHEIPLPQDLAGGNTTLNAKTATLKLSDSMEEDRPLNQATPAASDEAATNGDMPTTRVNGHSGDQEMSNGVNASSEHQSPIITPATTQQVQSPDENQQKQKQELQEQKLEVLPTPKDSTVAKFSPSPAPKESESRPQPPADAEVKPTSNGVSPSSAQSPQVEPPLSSPTIEVDTTASTLAESAPDEVNKPAVIPTTAVTADTQQAIAATTNITAMASTITAEDQEMPDAPPLSPATKVARERDDDESDGPAAKRAKTDEASPGDAQFKVPKLPASATAAGQPPATSAPISRLQSKFLTRTLQSLKRSHDARFYKLPVDPVKLNIPNYPLLVKRPMDLQTIEEKLKNSQYQTVDDVIADFKLMVDNSITFNGPEHLVAQEGEKLFKAFERHLSKLPRPEEVELTAAEKKAKKASTPGTKSQPKREARAPPPPPAPTPAPASAPAPAVTAAPAPAPVRAPAPAQKPAHPPSTTFALSPDGLPLIRRDSTNADGRPKRSIHPPKNRDFPYTTKPKKKKYQWELKFCQEVLDELHKPKHYSFAAPFYLPVDPVALNIPTYHSVIKKPMDLQTMQTKLTAGVYENAKEFEVDLRQIFKNCFKFNINGDPTYSAGKRLEEVFQNKWSQKGRWIEAHEPSSGHQSAGTSDNESDEEESDGDQELEKLSQLQKQIAEMSKQVELIQQKKKKTPPTSSKKVSKSKSKKDSSSSKKVTGKKEKKSSTSKSKPEKQRWVTYHEKQLISNGIGSLPEKRMNEALKIIQNNVPSLKGSNETEIELDMDELPNHVLLMLLNFVKKYAPAASAEFKEPSPAPDAPPPRAQAVKRRKHKPMTKQEQEAKINMIQGSLRAFQNNPNWPETAAAESSEDEEDSEESEEE